MGGHLIENPGPYGLCGGYTSPSIDQKKPMFLQPKHSTKRFGQRLARGKPAFSILELLLVLAISSILATVAVVLYQDYVETARLGVLDATIASIEPFQEAHKLNKGNYAEGSWRLESEDDQSLFEAIGWRPAAEDTDLVVRVSLVEGGFQVVASNVYGESLCREYPSRRTCDS